ncbi:hypothetical protein MBM_05918 [Drepanopeziza brunnea f. sp. 'multigermtubi' MB_m1]|uniref:Uncharacterized protein n=1 Tax=Marssonina brunnea f. sp. multigermtubi (strain MB_m1) TaxID=1072389 RepID=K1WTX2_MARBU|nr:uncharacterized protein MBM_05918 [Drepanopeziza brunnea f. sp. 'multigermtubi' MB_m1]EKD15907.1 hypothetical protein MBM_05918 [Drepanopeziza brunnea f. sp. 'multigermtubi' MB_m1]
MLPATRCMATRKRLSLNEPAPELERRCLRFECNYTRSAWDESSLQMQKQTSPRLTPPWPTSNIKSPRALPDSGPELA